MRWSAGLLAAACATAGCVDAHRPPARTHVNYDGPVASRDLERGGQVFATLCNPCHAGRVNPRGYHWSPAQMRMQIREGNAVMPGIHPEYLDDRDMEAVLAFLTAIGAVDAELPPPTADERSSHAAAVSDASSLARPRMSAGP